MRKQGGCFVRTIEAIRSPHGIEAQIEIIDNEIPTGALIAVQVKSGKSYFSENTNTSFVFRTGDKHIEYWSRHSLPVILVIYDPDEDTLYWE